MVIVGHLNGDRFPIILIQMEAIQIRNFNYSQISLQLSERHSESFCKNENPGLTWRASAALIVFIARSATWGFSPTRLKHKH